TRPDVNSKTMRNRRTPFLALVWSAAVALFGTMGCRREQAAHETRVVDSSTGQVSMKVTKYPAGTKSIGIVLRELTPEELRGLDHEANRSADFLRRHAPDAQGDLLERLDVAFAGWLQSKDPGRESPRDVERMVGAAYGRYCIERLGVRWAII